MEEQRWPVDFFVKTFASKQVPVPVVRITSYSLIVSVHILSIPSVLWSCFVVFSACLVIVSFVQHGKPPLSPRLEILGPRPILFIPSISSPLSLLAEGPGPTTITPTPCHYYYVFACWNILLFLLFVYPFSFVPPSLSHITTFDLQQWACSVSAV